MNFEDYPIRRSREEAEALLVEHFKEATRQGWEMGRPAGLAMTPAEHAAREKLARQNASENLAALRSRPEEYEQVISVFQRGPDPTEYFASILARAKAGASMKIWLDDWIEWPLAFSAWALAAYAGEWISEGVMVFVAPPKTVDHLVHAGISRLIGEFYHPQEPEQRSDLH